MSANQAIDLAASAVAGAAAVAWLRWTWAQRRVIPRRSAPTGDAWIKVMLYTDNYTPDFKEYTDEH